MPERRIGPTAIAFAIVALVALLFSALLPRIPCGSWGADFSAPFKSVVTAKKNGETQTGTRGSLMLPKILVSESVAVDPVGETGELDFRIWTPVQREGFVRKGAVQGRAPPPLS